MYYNEIGCQKYLEALKQEIDTVYRQEIVKTLYIGGGTPSSLSINNLKRLFDIIKIFPLSKDYEFTMEVNPENINEEKLLLMKEVGVNRISMGIESTNDTFLKYLGRHHNYSMVQEKIALMKKVGFTNINVDLIYAIPNETISDLQKDLDNLMKLDIEHISTYSLEIHSNTMMGIKKIKNIDDELDYKMYNFICDYLERNGFHHYEISNFCKNNYSKHNLIYWHNEHYYGFGLGASGYLGNCRYDNTRGLNNYLSGKRRINEEFLTKSDIISYELILGFRLINGISKKDFFNKYQEELINQYNIKELIKEGYLIDDGENIYIKKDFLYVENNILENFIE